MSQQRVIASRFNGPPGSGNGGYVCGVLAGEFGGDSAEVTLRKPPPLDRALALRVEARGSAREQGTEGVGEERHVSLWDGETLIASARAAEPSVLLPEPPSLAQAEAAEARYEGHVAHPYPGCFVCGPARAAGDGLRLFTGKLPERELVACAFRPGASFADADGNVDRAIVWSALDCPSYFGGRLRGFGRAAVLGRLTATVCRSLPVGAPYIVVGWPIAQEGRKWDGGSAIFSADGELCAFARGRWIELQ
jgi:hypothetical protein